jgi:hypothetical protein
MNLSRSSSRKISRHSLHFAPRLWMHHNEILTIPFFAPIERGMMHTLEFVLRQHMPFFISRRVRRTRLAFSSIHQ